jgi:hypothetical protein
MSLFNDLIDWPITSPRLQWEGKLVVRDWKNAPHLFFRLKLSGTYFVERSSEAFVQIGNLRSKFVQIAPDGLSVNGYFDKLPALEGLVEFGYGHQVFLICGRRFDIGTVARLKKALLPSKVRNLNEFAKLLEVGGPLG